MTSQRIAQTNQQQKSEKPQGSSTLQRAAVRSVSDAGMESTDDLEGLALSNSSFSKDFSQVPISTTKPQQIMAKLMVGPVGDKYEQEADMVAAQVVKQINAPVLSSIGQTIQRQMPEERKKEEATIVTDSGIKIQRKTPWEFTSYTLAKGENKYSLQYLEEQKDGKLNDHLGKDFNSDQRKKILEVNKKENNSVIKSDVTPFGELQLQDMKVTPHVDHRFPKAQGGTNSYKNARVISANANISKGRKTNDEVNQEPNTALPAYNNLTDENISITQYRDFTLEQKQNILAANKKSNGGVIKDDVTGNQLEQYDTSQIAHIDHITAKTAFGGSNYYFNAAVLPADENISKGGVRGKSLDYDYDLGEMNLIKLYKDYNDNNHQFPSGTTQEESDTDSVATDDEEDTIMMKTGVQKPTGEMAAPPDLEASINNERGGGQAMAENIRQSMEQAFGADFSGVKVHTNAQSDQLNRSIQARAFTTGQDVFFRRGEYNPKSRGGQQLLAHELTHVVQQNGGIENQHAKEIGRTEDKNSVQLINRVAIKPKKKEEETKASSYLYLKKLPLINSKIDIQRTLDEKEGAYLEEHIKNLKSMSLIVNKLDEEVNKKIAEVKKDAYTLSLAMVEINKYLGLSQVDEDGNVKAPENVNESRAQILAELNELIAAKKKKIDLYELRHESKNDPDGDAEIIQGFEKDISASTMAFILEAKSKKVEDKRNHYDPKIVEGGKNFENFLKVDVVNPIEKDNSQGFSYTIILLEDGHYTPLFITYENAKIYFFGVDAAGAEKNDSKFTTIANTNFGTNINKEIHYYSEGDIQFDNYSCGTFSLQDINRMTKMKVEELAAGIPVMKIPNESKESETQSLSQLSPYFIRNIQSNTKYNEYVKARENNAEEEPMKYLTKHVQQYTRIHYEISKTKEVNYEQRTKNRAIDYKTYKYLEAAKSLMIKLSPKEFSLVLKQRIWKGEEQGELKG